MSQERLVEIYPGIEIPFADLGLVLENIGIIVTEGTAAGQIAPPAIEEQLVNHLVPQLELSDQARKRMEEESIWELKLNGRARNLLLRALNLNAHHPERIPMIIEVLILREEELLGRRQLGDKALRSIKASLFEFVDRVNQENSTI